MCIGTNQDTDLAVRMKLHDGRINAWRRPSLGANSKRINLTVLAQQLAVRRNREHAVVQRVAFLITLHMAPEDCDAMATGHCADVLKPTVRLGGNPISPDDLGKCVSSRDELRRHDPIRTGLRGDLN